MLPVSVCVVLASMRMWKKTVTEQESGKKLEQVLQDAGFSKKEISRLKFRENGMRVAGRRCRSTEIISAGQEIVLCLEDAEQAPEIQPVTCETACPVEEKENGLREVPALSICYEDEDLLIADKPSGLSCHPGKGHYQINLGRQIQEYCLKKGENREIRLVGRLDKDTSGGVVFAKHQTAAARLWKQREKGIFVKKYRVLVHGCPNEEQGVISLPIRSIPGEKNRMCAAPDGKRAVTYYRVLRKLEREKAALLECTLETGRTHQIRVHMAAMGHPVFGDAFYGKRDIAERLCLHAGYLSLKQPFTGKQIEIEIPIKGIPFL